MTQLTTTRTFGRQAEEPATWSSNSPKPSRRRVVIPVPRHTVTPENIPVDPKSIHFADVNAMVTPGISSKVRNGLEYGKELASNTGRSAGELISSSWDALNELVLKSGSSPQLATAITGGISVVSLFKGAKNILHAFKSLLNPKSDPNVSWVMRAFQGFLELGLTWVTASPFLGTRTPFTRFYNGRPILPLQLVIGATLAPIFCGSVINLADGVSPFGRIPLIGTTWESICRTLSQGLRSVTTWGEPHSNMDQHQGSMQMAA